jgi:hypothetical protein
MAKIVEMLRLTILFSAMVLSSYAASSPIATEGDYCEILDMAEGNLTTYEKEQLLRFGISESPVEIEDENFYLIHRQLKGSCEDRFFTGSILARIVSGNIERQYMNFLNYREVYVIETIHNLWRRGGIRNTDLSHERELILTFEGFSLPNRQELIRTALEAEGLSHSVVYSLWTTRISEQSSLIRLLRESFFRSQTADEQMVAGLLLLRMGDAFEFEFVRILKSMNQSAERSNSVREMFRRLKDRQQIPFKDFDALELLNDD